MTDLEIRPVEARDADAVLGVVRAAFGAHDPDGGVKVADLWGDVRASDHLLAERVAVLDGQVVGHVGVSRCWIDARRELVEACMLSPLSTAPAHERRGIGTALVAAAVEAARELGCPAIFLEGSPDFYGRRGFEPAATYGFEAPSVRVPAPAFQLVLLSEVPDWLSGRVVYPDVWWRHDSTGLRDPDLAEVEKALGTG
ncbi:GNAT family N-acetyltransferase [Nocardioides oleivorans]|uniref:GNAT family N-acetyltransferase n=1 Tax=Nocardioides oleivorans TaxID=273676 RepID=UPI001A92160C|nr:N-acetyltransferase [Nocardioides oleivorans]